MSTYLARFAGCGVLVLLHATSGRAQSQPATVAKPVITLSAPANDAADVSGKGLVPAGFGSLKQDEIAVKLQLPDVLVKLMPLDEGVIRTLSPDSYRALRDLADSKRSVIARLASQHGLVRGNIWLVQFFGLAPDARFSPLELTVSSGGHDFRPVEVLPLTSGFGEQRLQPRQMQSALYVFEDALDVNQPMEVSLGSTRSVRWAETLQAIEQERATIRSRALSRAAAASP